MLYISPDTAKLQSNHRFYKSDIKPSIDQSDTNYKTRLVQTQYETLGEALHTSTAVLPFRKHITYNMSTHDL